MFSSFHKPTDKLFQTLKKMATASYFLGGTIIDYFDLYKSFEYQKIMGNIILSLLN